MYYGRFISALFVLGLAIFFTSSCSKTEDSAVEAALDTIEPNVPATAIKPPIQDAGPSPTPPAPAPPAKSTATRTRREPAAPRDEVPMETHRPAPRTSEPVIVPSTPAHPSADRAQAAKGRTEPSELEETRIITAAPRKVVLPEGTVVEVRLNEALSSGVNQSGDIFQATLEHDLTVEGEVVAPQGSRVVGRLTRVEESGRVEGRAYLSLTLQELKVGNRVYALQTDTLDFEAESTKGRDTKVIGGGAGLGAIIGAIAGGKKGAAIGAAIGGGAATAGVLATKGNEVTFEPEHLLHFRLERDLEMQRN